MCLESGGGGVFGAAGGVLVVFGSRVFFFLGFGGGSVFCLLFCIQFPSIETLSPWERILMHAPLLLTILAPTL
ncbi:hypothetical protein P8452_01253 [Trifolium repens]|nr:hypothetical protein P8452_01253 [Trifolium repens]